mgnify:CR=1 FL=1
MSPSLLEIELYEQACVEFNVKRAFSLAELLTRCERLNLSQMYWNHTMARVRDVNRFCIQSLMGGFLVVASSLWEASPQETHTKRLDIPGASLNQKITYYPNKEAYDSHVDEVLKLLRSNAGVSNEFEAPYKVVETLAETGVSIGIPGVDGASVGEMSGRESTRTITAAEEALELFNKE